MKKLIILIAAAIFSFSSLMAQDYYSLEVNIDKLKSDKGWVAVELLNKNNKRVSRAYVNIAEQQSKIKFDLLKPGQYAVRFFHDENRNGKMETNMVGIPKEGYGFSNNVRPTLGAPALEKLLFSISDDTSINIKAMY